MPRWPEGKMTPTDYKAHKAEKDRQRWAIIREKSTPGSVVPLHYNVPMGQINDLRISVPKHGLKIAYIPDAQVMKGVPLEHLKWCGQYIADKRPDVVVCGGDFGDFPSLSHFGSPKQFENKRYKQDIGTFKQGMDLLMTPLAKANGYDPYMEFLDGNHEGHIDRYVNENPKMEGMMSTADLRLKEYGWREHKFLQPISIGGVAFNHYFPSGVMGRPITKASQILTKLHMSAVAGHQQGKDIAFSRRADGGHLAAIITGSFYQHDYEYLSPFTNNHWRGMLMMHEVKDGAFDEMFVSINFLKRRFG